MVDTGPTGPFPVGALAKIVMQEKLQNSDTCHTAIPRATSVDAYVGRRIRLRRTLLGLSQEKLGELVGITFQQIQKYERGTNRVGASRLYDIAGALDVPIAFFFEGVDRHPSPGSGYRSSGVSESRKVFEGFPAHVQDSETAALLNNKDTLELVRAYHAIPDIKVRKNVLELVRSMKPDHTPTPE